MSHPQTPAMSKGFAQPIIWGLEEGYSISDIALGLSIRQGTVVAAVETWGPDWLAAQVRRTWRLANRIDETRAEVDWAYGNWARARRGAAAHLDALEGYQ